LQADGVRRPAFRKPANDNRLPVRRQLALWAFPLAVLALAAAGIGWAFG